MSPVTEHVERDHRPNVYLDGGLVVYRMSAIGSCLAALQYARLGMRPEEPPAAMRRRFDDSQLHEEGIVDHALNEFELTAHVDDPPVVVLPITQKVIARGAVDCRTLEGPVVEAKALAESGWLRWKEQRWDAFDRYAWQMSGYLEGAIEAGWGDGRLVMAVKCVSRESEHYGAIDLSMWEEPVYTRDQIAERVLMVEQAYQMGDDPECSQRDYPCPYWWIGECGDTTADEAAEVDDEEQFAAWAEGHHELRQQIKGLEAALQKSKERGMELVPTKGKVAAGGWECRRSEYEREFLSQKDVKARWPEVWEECKRATHVVTLTVKEQGGG